ncbi:hypothetical protein Tco_0052479, partial [Tanacetum coccineum]
DGMSSIAAKLGTPIMLDSYTADIYLQSWGRSSYARLMIKLRADVELKDTNMDSSIPIDLSIIFAFTCKVIMVMFHEGYLAPLRIFLEQRIAAMMGYRGGSGEVETPHCAAADVEERGICGQFLLLQSSVGTMFLLGYYTSPLLQLVLSRAEEMPSVNISCWMQAKGMAGVREFDILVEEAVNPHKITRSKNYNTSYLKM